MFFRRHANIEKVLIFGSRSKGNFRAGSDIDLAIVGKGIDYSLLLTIQCEIDDLDMLYSIDLLDYNKEKGTPIGDHIDRVGQIFYEAAQWMSNLTACLSPRDACNNTSFLTPLHYIRIFC